MSRTKIVATLGPSTSDRGTIQEMVEAGADVFRQNFSHGTRESHEELYDNVRDVSDSAAAMLDTRGPEIRVDGPEEMTLEEGSTVKVTGDGGTGSLSVDHPDMLDYLEEGDRVMVDDGRVELEVEEAGDEAVCRVVYGGEVGEGEAVNVPGKELGLSSPMEQDVEDIEFGIEKGFDFVSASFVKTAEDVERIEEVIEENGSEMKVIAKIEHVRAAENVDEIVEAADGVMVARGDLGVELPASQVPTLQKRIIRKCNEAGKPVITATEMLTSMTESPRATRAEVSDVANAVLDGSDAVMLSEETAVGEYPVETVEFMSEVLDDVEEEWSEELHRVSGESTDTSQTICRNIWEASKDLELEYIAAHTTSGFTARNIAKHRPATPIAAFTDTEKVKRQLNLTWGVEAFRIDFPEYVDQLIEKSARRLHEEGMVEEEDEVVFSAGTPTSVSGTTNMMEIREIGSLLD